MQNSAITFLEKWIGNWEGTGLSQGRTIRDLMMVQWVLNRRFLRFTYAAMEGDSYTGEGYFWYNPQFDRYEWWEFNNGKWPVRHHVGFERQNQLVLEEHDGDRHMRLIFTFKDDHCLEMTEGFLQNDHFHPYVVMQFRKEL